MVNTAFCITSEIKQKYLFSFLFNKVIEALPNVVEEGGKKMKGIEIGKKEVKVSLFTVNVILYIENPLKKSTNIN